MSCARAVLPEPGDNCAIARERLHCGSVVEIADARVALRGECLEVP